MLKNNLHNNNFLYDSFISYSHKNKEFTNKLAKQLIKKNFKVFYDEKDINWGESLVRSIENAINSARYILIVPKLSDSFVNMFNNRYIFSDNYQFTEYFLCLS